MTETRYRQQIGKEDLDFWQGGSDPKTFTRYTSTGAEYSMTKFGASGPYSFEELGAVGSTMYAHTEAELTTALADTTVQTIVVDAAFALTANRTITKPIYIAKGAPITCTGYVLTISAPLLSTGAYQQFVAASGELKFGALTLNGPALLEWVGGVGDDSTDNLAACNTIFNAFTSDGEILLLDGTYRISNYWDIRNTSLASTNTMRIKGKSWRTSTIKLTNDIGAYALVYDDGSNESAYGTSKHSIELMDFSITSTLAATITPEMTYHPGKGIYTTARQSKYRDLYIIGFTYGLHAYAAWQCTYDRVSTPYCLKGITLDRQSQQTSIANSPGTNVGGSATPSDGYGILIKRCGGITLSNLVMESSTSPGLILENVWNTAVSGGNFETYPTNRAIILRGLTGGDYSSVNTWTTGVTIDGVRLWNSLGFQINEGVGLAKLTGNSQTNNPGQLEPNAVYGLNISGVTTEAQRNHIYAIDYDDTNHWLHDVVPGYYRTAGYTHAVSKSGLRMLSAIPTTGTWQAGTKIINSVNPAFHWMCKTAGTLGILNGSSTIGTIDIGADAALVTLSSLTGIFPGARVTIAGAGAAGVDLPVTIGGVDVDNLQADFYPSASTSVVGAAVVYTAPAFMVGGEDNTVKTYVYAASVAPDLALGGRVYIGQLTGDVEIANPTNALVGQKFSVTLTADGSARNITYGTAFRAGGTSSLNANKTITLEFFVYAAAGAGRIRQINTPIEQS